LSASGWVAHGLCAERHSFGKLGTCGRGSLQMKWPHATPRRERRPWRSGKGTSRQCAACLRNGTEAVPYGQSRWARHVVGNAVPPSLGYGGQALAFRRRFRSKACGVMDRPEGAPAP